MSLQNPLDPELPVWQRDDGSPVSCTEKVKVLNENFRELQQVLRDALEDGILMGCSEAQMRGAIRELVDTIQLDFGN